METISIFDIFKIGVGPSSSHTLGPWKAALHFSKTLSNIKFNKVQIHLYGSLSKTGVGHATDIALQLGLLGYLPETIDTSEIATHLTNIKNTSQLQINDLAITFEPNADIIFENYALPHHPNTLTFIAYLNKQQVTKTTYYSIGGGFIEKEGESKQELDTNVKLKFPINKAADLTKYIENTGLPIHEIVYENELCFNSSKIIEEKIHNIYNTMLQCVYNGCNKGGILPGGLNVKRRAYEISTQLLNGQSLPNVKEWMNAIKKTKADFTAINKWVSCFALAVNEENAAMGRVVTSPTNGAAGVIPAVLLHYVLFATKQLSETNVFEAIKKFLLTAGEIGCLFKKGATISAAVGGCQAEIGVSSAMAAAGLTEVLGGSPGQVLMAAEIAMEHHLGLTCDPIKGLVQIPCIERNAMGANKAITAANLAIMSKPENAVVNLDAVIKSMWDTAQDMSHKYKETAEGGLAINISVGLSEC